MKRHVSLIILPIILGLFGSLTIFTLASAQQGTQDAFTYFIPYPAKLLDDQFDAGFDGSSWVTGGGFAFSCSPIEGDDIVNVISIAVDRSGTVIYYDHWEDTLEPHLTSPTQNTTQIWGDGDITNGVAPTIRSQGGGDSLLAGDIVRLQNQMSQALIGDIAQRYFDGGDALTAVNGPIAVSYAAWPFHSPPDSCTTIETRYAGAWELYPTNRWGNSYVIPIGEDLAPPPPPKPYLLPAADPPLNGTQAGFRVVGFNVQALQDNTTVSIDLKNGAIPPYNVNLDYGKQHVVISGTNTGATINATGPVQVHIFTANPAGIFEARAYSIIPTNQWTSDYLAPRSSDGAYWIYNPNSSSINVNVITTSTTSLNISAGQAIKYEQSVYTIPVRTGARFTSGSNFFVLAALDKLDAQDWGYAVQPVKFLTTQYLIGWGPGNVNNPPDGNQSPVYVTVPDNTTVVRVDYDNNGAVDQNFNVNPRAEVAVTNPDPTNRDMTGARLYSDNPNDIFAVVWGQDQDADVALPSLDLGTSIVPLFALNVQKTFKLVNEADCTGSISQDDTLRFTLQYLNNAVYNLNNVNLQDVLPASLTYVPNSVVLNGVPKTDAEAAGLFQAGTGYEVGALSARSVGTLTFEAKLNSVTGAITNRAGASSRDISLDDTATVLVPTGPFTPVLKIDMKLASTTGSVVQVGQAVTFSLSITNTDPLVTITKLPLEIAFNESQLIFQSANPGGYTQSSGKIRWDDLVATFGQNLPPGQTFNLTTTYTVNNVQSEVDSEVQANVIDAVRSDGNPPLTCHNEANVRVAPVQSPPSEGGGNDSDDDNASAFVLPTPTPTPVPTSIPTPIPTPGPTAALPVQFLPETGLRAPAAYNVDIIGGGIALLAISSIGLAVFLAKRHLKPKK